MHPFFLLVINPKIFFSRFFLCCDFCSSLMNMPITHIEEIETTLLTLFGRVLHCQMQNFFIEPPPDTQRKERQGERGMWVATSCYLSHATPPLPPPPPPHIVHLSHRLRPRYQD
jgi:hypothetical protein